MLSNQAVRNVCSNCNKRNTCSVFSLPEDRRIYNCPILFLTSPTEPTEFVPKLDQEFNYSELLELHRIHGLQLNRFLYRDIIDAIVEPEIEKKTFVFYRSCDRIRLKITEQPEYSQGLPFTGGDILSWLFPYRIEEGAIPYRKAVKIAFDVATPDTIAKQFAEVLSDAKERADKAGEPVSLFAQFTVKPGGELTFDCPIEYRHNARAWELQAILCDKFNVKSYKGKIYHSLTKEECRAALKQIRSGNTDLFKFKN